MPAAIPMGALGGVVGYPAGVSPSCAPSAAKRSLSGMQLWWIEAILLPATFIVPSNSSADMELATRAKMASANSLSCWFRRRMRRPDSGCVTWTSTVSVSMGMGVWLLFACHAMAF